MCFSSSPLHKRKTRKGIKAFGLPCLSWFSLPFRSSCFFFGSKLFNVKFFFPPFLWRAMNAERKHFDKFVEMPAAGIYLSPDIKETGVVAAANDTCAPDCWLRCQMSGRPERILYFISALCRILSSKIYIFFFYDLSVVVQPPTLPLALCWQSALRHKFPSFFLKFNFWNFWASNLFDFYEFFQMCRHLDSYFWSRSTFWVWLASTASPPLPTWKLIWL